MNGTCDGQSDLLLLDFAHGLCRDTERLKLSHECEATATPSGAVLLVNLLSYAAAAKHGAGKFEDSCEVAWVARCLQLHLPQISDT